MITSTLPVHPKPRSSVPVFETSCIQSQEHPCPNDDCYQCIHSEEHKCSKDDNAHAPSASNFRKFSNVRARPALFLASESPVPGSPVCFPNRPFLVAVWVGECAVLVSESVDLVSGLAGFWQLWRAHRCLQSSPPPPPPSTGKIALAPRLAELLGLLVDAGEQPSG